MLKLFGILRFAMQRALQQSKMLVTYSYIQSEFMGRATSPFFKLKNKNKNMANYIIKTPPYVGDIKYGYPVGTPCEISAEDLKTLKAAGIEIIKESEQEVTEQDNAPLTVIKTKKGK